MDQRTLYLADETGKIRASGSGPEVAERCRNVEPLKEYDISGIAVVEDRQSMRFPAASAFSLRLTEDTTFKFIKEVPRTYNFVKIAELPKVKDLFDVLGVITHVSGIDNSWVKKKRDIVLMDRSGADVVLTLWSEQVEECHPKEGSVLAVQLAYISKHYDVNLATCEWTSLEVDPDLPEARELSQWYQNEGRHCTPEKRISTDFPYPPQERSGPEGPALKKRRLCQKERT